MPIMPIMGKQNTKLNYHENKNVWILRLYKKITRLKEKSLTKSKTIRGTFIYTIEFQNHYCG